MSLLEIIDQYPDLTVQIKANELLEFGKSLIAETRDQIQLDIEMSKKPDIGGLELASEVTGFQPQTLYKYVQDRKIPFMKKGGKLFFSRSDLENWIKEGNDGVN